ncbi:MAG TPA: succinate dehydrogenase, cytochrome b556 subunit [Steroidobacteraceae bacterium]|jgi:succinate dehydrogenase / fumarate reductase cytochrome b subunit
MPERPLSPYLSVYKFKYTLVTSILNRLAGLVLSLGFVLLAYWLVALAGGARTYAQARALLALGIFKIVYALMLAAFAYHLIAGLRHLIWDTGRGLDRRSSRRSAWWVAALSIIATLALAYLLLRPGAYAQ